MKKVKISGECLQSCPIIAYVENTKLEVGNTITTQALTEIQNYPGTKRQGNNKKHE